MAGIEMKDPSERSRIEIEELPRLSDFRTHLELNLGRARAQNLYLPKGGMVLCSKCGNPVAIPK